MSYADFPDVDAVASLQALAIQYVTDETDQAFLLNLADRIEALSESVTRSSRATDDAAAAYDFLVWCGFQIP